MPARRFAQSRSTLALRLERSTRRSCFDDLAPALTHDAARLALGLAPPARAPRARPRRARSSPRDRPRPRPARRGPRPARARRPRAVGRARALARACRLRRAGRRGRALGAAGPGGAAAGSSPPKLPRPTASRSRMKRPAASSSRTSSSSVAACSVARTRSRSAGPALPVSLAIASAQSASAEVSERSSLHRLAQHGRVAPGEQVLVGGAQALAGRDQRVGLHAAPAHRLVERPRSHGRLAQRLDPRRRLAVARPCSACAPARRARARTRRAAVP